MNNTLQIKVEDSTTDLLIKEYEQQRVVTFKDIDELHQRAEGTARRNFHYNKKRFKEGVDFFRLRGESLRSFKEKESLLHRNISDLITVTQTGYSMLVKSMRDSLSWEIQTQMAEKYFI